MCVWDQNNALARSGWSLGTGLLRKCKGTRSLRMRTKYIMSCTRPPVWRQSCETAHLILSHDSMMAYLPAFAASPQQDRGQRYRTTQNACTPAISPTGHLTCQQLGLCAQSLKRDRTGLAYPNSCRLYCIQSAGSCIQAISPPPMCTELVRYLP